MRTYENGKLHTPYGGHNAVVIVSRPMWLNCKSEVCANRKTKHFPNRTGVNGTLYVCSACGEERTK